MLTDNNILLNPILCASAFGEHVIVDHLGGLVPHHINYKDQPESWNATRRGLVLAAAFGDQLLLAHATHLVVPGFRADFQGQFSFSGFSLNAILRAISHGRGPIYAWGVDKVGCGQLDTVLAYDQLWFPDQ